MHGRWSIPVRLGINRWSWVILVVVFAASTSAMPPRSLLSEMKTLPTDDDEVKEEIEAIKERILADLGLSKIPDVTKANVSASQMELMLELYRRSVLETEKEEMEAEQTVLRVYSYEDTAPLEYPIFTFGSSTSSKRVYFPLHINPSLQQKGHYIKSAKLHVPIEKGWSNPRMLIYRLLEDPSSPNSSRSLVINQLMDITSLNNSQLDISDTVRQWVEHPDLNFGLLLECKGCWNTSIALSKHHESPVLDVLVSELPARVKRSSRFRYPNLGMTTLDCTKGLRTRKCCRRALTVSFKDIGWHWIVQPTEFEAYYCKGRCSLRSSRFATTHALIQNILNRKGRKVPRPCCAPTKLRPLNLLHYNDDDSPELVLTKQKGMIVKECACL